MNKDRSTISLAVLLIAIGVVSITIGYINSTDPNAQQYRFATQEEALIDGINQNSSEDSQPEDPLENIILSTEHDLSLYVVVAVPFSEYGMNKDYVYVAAVKEKNNKFRFEKLSPDISLNTLGDVRDVDYVPNATFFFDDIDGLYFAVGKIYDEKYRPYYLGKQLKLLKHNIYVVVQEKERPQIDVVKEN